MRLTRALALVVVIGAGATASAGGARPVSAADLLAAARQMVLVTTPDWNTVQGTLETFERSGPGEWTEAKWRRGDSQRSSPGGTTIVVGKNGSAWDPSIVPPVPGPVKAEGDGRSPAGVFALGTAFGFANASDARWTKLTYTELTPTIECVDDTGSGYYNTLTDRATVTPDWSSSEKMRQVDPQYRWGVVVEYNTSPAVPKRGSCIFLHIAGADGTGTAGCTAMDETALKAVMQWLDPKKAPVLVQLPVAAHGALRTAWALPELPAAR